MEEISSVRFYSRSGSVEINRDLLDDVERFPNYQRKSNDFFINDSSHTRCVTSVVIDDSSSNAARVGTSCFSNDRTLLVGEAVCPGAKI